MTATPFALLPLMGMWSDEIFGNELACDVQAEYRGRRAARDSGAAAFAHVKRGFAEARFFDDLP